MNRIRQYYILAFFIPVTIFLTLLCTTHIEPFGSNTILANDLFHQYNLFHIKLAHIVQNGQWSELFFQWTDGLGTPFIGTFAYYLTSPFTIITLIGNEDSMPLLLTLIIGLKIGLIGLTSYFGFSRLTKTNSFELLLFSTAYATSGYVLLYYRNLMWLDTLILLPLIVEAFHLWWKYGTKRWLLLTLILSFWTNFYLSYMVGIALWLYATVLFFSEHSLKEWKEYLKKILSLLALALLALGILAPLFLPTLLTTLTESLSSTQTLQWLANPLELSAQLLINNYNGINNSALSPLYFGLFALPLMIQFFFLPNVKKSLKIGFLGLILSLILGSLITPIEFFWHVGQKPSWFPGRQLFILTYLCLALSSYTYFKLKEVNSFIFKAHTLTFIWLGSLYLLWNIDLLNLKTRITAQSLIISFLFLLSYLILTYLHHKRGLGFYKNLFLALCLFELVFNGVLTHQALILDHPPITTDGYQLYLTELNNFLEKHPDPTNSTIRSLDLNSRLYNASFIGNYSSIRQFNSMGHRRVNWLLNSLSRNNSIQSQSFYLNSDYPILNNLLGVRYLQTQTPLNSLTLAIDEYFYESPFSLPIGFQINAGSEIPLTQDRAIMKQEALIQNLSGSKEKVYSQIPSYIWSSENLKYDPDEKIFTKLDETKSAFIQFNFTLPENGELYLNLPIKYLTQHQFKCLINDTSFSNETTELNWIRLSSPLPQETSVRLEFTEDASVSMGEPFLFEFHPTPLKTMLETLQEDGFELKEQTPTRFSGTITMHPNKDLLLTLPQNLGWKATLNGEPIPIKSFLNAFMLLEIPEGTHELEFTFTPNGFKEGILISIMVLNGLAAYLILTHLRRES